MNYFAVRITIFDEKPTLQDLKDFLNVHTDISLVKEFKSYDPDVGPHYQGYYYGEKSIESLKRWITKELGCKGNESYSLKQADIKKFEAQGGIEGYFRYICKSRNKSEPPIEYYNLDESFIHKYHSLYYKIKDEFKQAKKSKPKRTQQLLDFIADKAPDQLSQLKLMELILEFHKENHLMVSDFQAELYYHFVNTHYHDNYIQTRSRNIINRINNRDIPFSR